MTTIAIKLSTAMSGHKRIQRSAGRRRFLLSPPSSQNGAYSRTETTASTNHAVSIISANASHAGMRLMVTVSPADLNELASGVGRKQFNRGHGLGQAFLGNVAELCTDDRHKNLISFTQSAYEEFAVVKADEG